MLGRSRRYRPRTPGTDTIKLPGRAANVPCYYFYDDELARITELQARLLSEPDTRKPPDDSPYRYLQPGVRVSSDYTPSMLRMIQSTTTGVLVMDERGNEFLTVL